MARIVMIHDTPSSFSRNVRNGILIASFDNPGTQSNDIELLSIMDYLSVIEDFDDLCNMETR